MKPIRIAIPLMSEEHTNELHCSTMSIRAFFPLQLYVHWRLETNGRTKMALSQQYHSSGK